MELNLLEFGRYHIEESEDSDEMVREISEQLARLIIECAGDITFDKKTAMAMFGTFFSCTSNELADMFDARIEECALIAEDIRLECEKD